MGKKLEYNENLILPNTFANLLDLSYFEVPLYFRWFLLLKNYLGEFYLTKNSNSVQKKFSCELPYNTLYMDSDVFL